MQKREFQAKQDNNASSYSKANTVGKTISKSYHLYKNKSWDLVDAEEENEVVLEDLKDDALPKELKGKSLEDIKTYIDKNRD